MPGLRVQRARRPGPAAPSDRPASLRRPEPSGPWPQCRPVAAPDKPSRRRRLSAGTILKPAAGPSDSNLTMACLDGLTFFLASNSRQAARGLRRPLVAAQIFSETGTRCSSSLLGTCRAAFEWNQTANNGKLTEESPGPGICLSRGSHGLTGRLLRTTVTGGRSTRQCRAVSPSDNPPAPAPVGCYPARGRDPALSLTRSHSNDSESLTRRAGSRRTFKRPRPASQPWIRKNSSVSGSAT